jgi:antitoxin (DNA-binding transcriptional repressor) of toxin-antitoxin stability system
LSNVSIQEAQAHLPDLIDRLVPGEELIVTRDNRPVARLARSALTSWPCKAGSAKDSILSIADDFDAPLDDFREYVG